MALGQYVPAGAQWNADEVAARIGVHWIRTRPRVSNLLHTGLLRLTDPLIQRPSANGAPADCLTITAAGLLAWHSPDPLPKPPRTEKKGAAA